MNRTGDNHEKLTTIIWTLLFILLSTALYAVQTDVAGCKDHPALHEDAGLLDPQLRPEAVRRLRASLDGQGEEPSHGGRAVLEAPTTRRPISNRSRASCRSSATSRTPSRSWAARSSASEKSRKTFKLVKDGKEIWVELSTEFTGKYGFVIVQKEGMAQDIVANAEALANDIRTTGHAAVYGIYFDTGKSTIKPESAQAIGEIAKLLKADPALKLYVVGHTDNVGGVDSNIKLSQDRAEAVMQALVREHGIAAGAAEGLRVRPVRPGGVQRHRGRPGQEPPGRAGQAVGQGLAFVHDATCPLTGEALGEDK